ERNQRLDRDSRGGLLERGEREFGFLRERRCLEVDRERQHFGPYFGADGRRLFQELLISINLLLEQALKRAWLGGASLGHWFHLSNEVAAVKDKSLSVKWRDGLAAIPLRRGA